MLQVNFVAMVWGRPIAVSARLHKLSSIKTWQDKLSVHEFTWPVQSRHFDPSEHTGRNKNANCKKVFYTHTHTHTYCLYTDQP